MPETVLDPERVRHKMQIIPASRVFPHLPASFTCRSLKTMTRFVDKWGDEDEHAIRPDGE